MNPKVDWFFSKAKKWKEELGLLRRIILSSGLTEELKWGVPCYTYEGKNIVLIHAFKDYCAVLFHKGALLNDTQGVLIIQSPNVQAARQMRFTGIDEVLDREGTTKAYVRQAIQVEKSGQKVTFKQTSEFVVPAEFQQVLKGTPSLKKAFNALTPGRQRGYLLYFSSAKQSKTRESRIEKSIPKILQGLGLDD